MLSRAQLKAEVANLSLKGLWIWIVETYRRLDVAKDFAMMITIRIVAQIASFYTPRWLDIKSKLR